ncbi:MAG: helix-turn-helix domain-containing protein [Saprospiraceae bacterium]|nr:helix-turn-helix domain-containing protein [Saprospiraceae bacterium]
MKATLEKIEPVFGNSFTVRKFTDINYLGKPYWHFHPEYEIVYISNGHGKRHIGEHISYYEHGDLIFLGPNMPHFGFSEELYDEHVEVVVQMREDFLGREFLDKPELAAIKQLFERSHRGVTFHGEAKHRIGEELMQMVEYNGFERLVRLLRILQSMAQASDYTLLNAGGFAVEVGAQDHERMRTIYAFVDAHYNRHITLDEVAGEINMTVPAFCRYFKKLTNKTFTHFVNEFRIAHAGRMLADEHLSIAAVSYESGFNNLSHFNKQFRQITGASPRDYRRSLRKVVGV